MAKGDIISRLKLESGEFDSKIKRASQELLAYSEHCKKMSLQMGYANTDAKEFAKQLGSMATVSTTARGKINELSDAFVNAKVMYKNMTDAEKNSPFGRNLAASLDQLKTRLNDAKQDLTDVQKELSGSKFGEFGNIIDTLGLKLGVTGNLTEMLTSKTAMLTAGIGASVAIIAKATEAWASYNAELAKQDQITQVTTGLKGEDADRMTDTMRALSDTYNVDFREAVNAANTLMSQFGATGDEAIQMIKDGMQGMIQGDGPKLLSMIQQYAPSFRDAGVSASKLVAVIQNSEGGIFTDQNMNAIVMGIKNIRLMTKATSDALAQLGIDGEKMSKQLSDGSLTIFDALKQVANQIQNVDSNSKAAGEVMQQVFGRQGAMAGTKLGEAIATLNTNLEQTKKQTGELGDALANLQTANEKLNKAIRDCFEYDGWDKMATGIKTNLVNAMADVLELAVNINKTFKNNLGFSFFDGIRNSANKALAPLGAVLGIIRHINKELGRDNANAASEGVGIGGAIAEARNPKGIVQGRYVEVTDSSGNVISGTHYNVDLNGRNIVPSNPTNQTTTTTKKTGGNNAPTYMEGSLSEQMALVSELTKKWHDASGEIKDGYLAQLVAAEALLQKMKDSDALDKWAAGYNMRKGDQSFEVSSFERKSVTDDGFAGIKNQTFTGFSSKAQKALEDQIKKSMKGSEKEDKKSFVQVGDQLMGGVNNMVSSLDQLGIEMPEGFQNVLTGINGMLGVLQSIAMIVEAIHAFQEVGSFLGIFNNGGIVPHAANGYYVPGNRFSTDTTPILANAGELVLNKAAQGNLASQLEGGISQFMKLDAVVTGEQIRLVMNNNGRRTGRGEYVQTNRR